MSCYHSPEPPLFGQIAVAKAMLSLPFDMLRTQHARAVEVGLLDRSMIEAARFEHLLGAVEQILLGPFARRA